MKKVLGSILLLLVLPLAACGDDETGATTTTDDDQPVGDILALTGNAADGDVVYQDSCAQTTCHLPDGSGFGDAKDLATEVPARDDEALARVIKYGTIDDGGIMPAQTQLSAQDIADVMAYLRSEFP